jgi:parallel beta-helix repeat protein
MDAASDNITFNIPGAGVHTIAPATPLPAILQPATIDGYTQPGASPNTGAVGQALNGVLLIEIDCTNAGFPCLGVSASNVTLRGLVLNRATTAAIWTVDPGAQNLVVEGCYLGTTPDGMQVSGGTGGIALTADNARIGGTSPASRNLFVVPGAVQINIQGASDSATIQGNLFCTDRTGMKRMPNLTFGPGFGGVTTGNGANVLVGGTTPGSSNVFACPGGGVFIGNGAGHTVQGNFIGVDATGTRLLSLARTGDGIRASGSSGALLGGSTPGAGNVVGGHLNGISIGSSLGVVVAQGNVIGTDPTATRDFGNTIGIQVAGENHDIGGVGAGEGNVVMNNRDIGIRVSGFGSGITVRGNRIFGNGLGAIGQLGLDLDNGSGAPTPNDAGDGDTGPNGFQNFPVITSAAPEGGGTRVIGTLNSAASTTYTLDFYGNPPCRARPKDLLEADQYLGTTMVTTDGSGNAAFNVLLPVAILAGSPVTSTATAPDGSTSELSQEIVFSSSPDGGEAVGGDPIGIKGMLFQAGATVTIGTTPATNIIVSSDTNIVADAPALPAGTVHDIVVTTGGLTGRLRNGYAAFFNEDNTFWPSTLLANGVTAGCGGGNYCSGDPVTRAQMAVFLLRGKRGLCYTPPPATGAVFGDVSTGTFAAAWIEALAAAQVTSGCGGGNYCPDAGVTRDSMAVFLLRMAEGPDYVAPPCTTATFTDVPCANPFSAWIYELVSRGITAGCGGSLYCPTASVTRFQMAVFLTVTFGLP